MSFFLFFGTAVVPGIVAAGVVARFYKQNQVSGRYVFLPVDPLLERQISRKLLKTWGERTLRKYEKVENTELETIWQEVKKKAKVSLPGKVNLLSTADHIFIIFPTGDLFISTKYFTSLNEKSLKAVLSHELAHIQLHHHQESIEYSKLTSLLMCYFCRHNHHISNTLKSYLLFPSYTSLQESEANKLAKKNLNEEFDDFLCENALSNN